MSAIPYVSNRFAMKRYLGLSEEELTENERLWREENDENITPPPTDAGGDLRGAVVSGAGIDADMAGMEEEVPGGEAPVDGGATDAPETATGGEGVPPQEGATDITV